MPRDRAARRRGCGARRRTLVVELSVRGADSRALGEDQTSASISARLNARGVSDVVVVPVGFVSDHVELLFDVDVKARAVADELGMRLERPALNDDPVFIEALAELVRGRTGEGRRRGGRNRGARGGARARASRPGRRDRPRRAHGATRRKALDRAGGRVRDREGAADSFLAEGTRRRALRGARARQRADRAQAGECAQLRQTRLGSLSVARRSHRDDPDRSRCVDRNQAPLGGGTRASRGRANLPRGGR